MESLAGLSQLIGASAAGDSAEKFSEAGIALVKARDEIREKVQEQTAGAMKPIIHKLERNEPLTPEEKRSCPLMDRK